MSLQGHPVGSPWQYVCMWRVWGRLCGWGKGLAFLQWVERSHSGIFIRELYIGTTGPGERARKVDRATEAQGNRIRGGGHGYQLGCFPLFIAGNPTKSGLSRRGVHLISLSRKSRARWGGCRVSFFNGLKMPPGSQVLPSFCTHPQPVCGPLLMILTRWLWQI